MAEEADGLQAICHVKHLSLNIHVAPMSIYEFRKWYGSTLCACDLQDPGIGGVLNCCLLERKGLKRDLLKNNERERFPEQQNSLHSTSLQK